MRSSSGPIPLDILVLIKAAVDPRLIGPHLLLSNLSRQVRDHLYPHDRTWRLLLNGAGIGRSLHDLDGQEKTRWWREIAVEVAKHEQDEGQPGACSLPSEDWVDRNEVHETMCVRVRNFNLTSYGLPLVAYSAQQVRQQQLTVKPHPKLEDLDCKGLDCNLLGFQPRWGKGIGHSRSREGCLCKDHPVACHSFATVPPVSEMRLIGIEVYNPDGITQWDVRMAMEKSYPYLTKKEFKRLTGSSYKQALEENFYNAEYAEKMNRERKLVRECDFLIHNERYYEGMYANPDKGSVNFSFHTGS